MFKTSSSVRALLGVLACQDLLELLKHHASSTSLQHRQSTGQSTIHRARYKKIFQIHVEGLKRNASGDGRLLLSHKMGCLPGRFLVPSKTEVWIFQPCSQILTEMAEVRQGLAPRHWGFPKMSELYLGADKCKRFHSLSNGRKQMSDKSHDTKIIKIAFITYVINSFQKWPKMQF